MKENKKKFAFVWGIFLKIGETGCGGGEGGAILQWLNLADSHCTAVMK